MEYLTDPHRIAAFFAARIAEQVHHYEQMARDVEHPGPIGCWEGQRFLAMDEYLIVNVYRPRDGRAAGLHPVIAFGNTRLSADALAQLMADVHEDLFPLGIGTYRWAYNGGRILQLLQDLNNEYGRRAILTGHSLGGALAQITSCYGARLVEAVYTFQAPKTSLGNVATFRAQGRDDVYRLKRNTFHYAVEGDMVGAAGEVFTPGAMFLMAYRPEVWPAGDDPLAAMQAPHTMPIFPPFARLRTIRSEGVRVARGTIASVGVARLSPRPSESLADQAVEALRRFGVPVALGVAGLAGAPLAGGAAVSYTARVVRDTLYVLAWDVIAVEVLALRAERDVRAACRRLRRLRFTLFAFPTDANVYTPRDVLTDSQVANMERQIDLLCRQSVTAAQSPVESPLMHEVRGRLELLDAGVEWLRDADPRAGRRAADDVRAIFNGTRVPAGEGLQAAWLEMVIAEDILRHFNARRVGPGTGQAGMYAAETANGAAFILVGLALRQCVEHLLGAGVLAPGQVPGSAADRLDDWSVMRYCVDAIRGPSADPDLKTVYGHAHQRYLGCDREDPLRLLSPREVAATCCAARREPEPFSLDAFRALAASYRRADDLGTLPESQAAEARARMLAHQWYTFLFKLGAAGTGFVADEHFRVAACTQPARPCTLAAGDGIKKVGDKRIDIVQIVPERRYIEVLDATYRFDHAWHNFKTEFYAAFFRRVFAAVGGDWRVEGLDYRNAHMRHGTPPARR